MWWRLQAKQIKAGPPAKTAPKVADLDQDWGELSGSVTTADVLKERLWGADGQAYLPEGSLGRKAGGFDPGDQLNGVTCWTCWRMWTLLVGFFVFSSRFFHFYYSYRNAIVHICRYDFGLFLYFFSFVADIAQLLQSVCRCGNLHSHQSWKF